MKLSRLFGVLILSQGIASCGSNEVQTSSVQEKQPDPQPIINSSTGEMVYDGKMFCHAEAVTPTLIMLSLHCAQAMNVGFDEVSFVTIHNGEVITSVLYNQEMGPGSLWIKEREPDIEDMEKYPEFYTAAKDKFFLRLRDKLPDDFSYGQMAKLDDVVWKPYPQTSLQYTDVIMTTPSFKDENTFKIRECRAFRYESSNELIFSDCPEYRGDSGTGVRSAQDPSKVIALATGALGGFASELLARKDFKLSADIKILADEIGRMPGHNASLNSMKELCQDNIVPCNIMQ